MAFWAKRIARGGRQGGPIRGRQGRRKDRRENGPYRPNLGGEEASDTVFVGQLSPETSKMELLEHMQQAGEVAFCDVREGRAGYSYGLVRFSSAEDAENAITMMNESELKDTVIHVRLDRRGGRRGGNRQQSQRGGKGKQTNGNRNGNRRGGPGGAEARSVEQLDAAMDQYFAGGGAETIAPEATTKQGKGKQGARAPKAARLTADELNAQMDAYFKPKEGEANASEAANGDAKSDAKAAPEPAAE